MTSIDLEPGASPLLERVGLVALWAIGLAAFVFLKLSAPVGGAVFVLLGVVVLSLTAFTPAELRSASRTSVAFWEGAARNAWLLGAVASLLFFARGLGDSSGGLAQVARDLALAFVPSAYGLALAGLCAVPALRLQQASAQSPRGTTAGGRVDAWLGTALFLVLVAVLMRPASGGTSGFTSWALLLHWPAALVVAGGTLLVVAIAGTALRGRIGVAALSLAGALGSLAGLVQVLLGFADQAFPRIVAGLSFILTACFVALVGLLVVANPIEDRRSRHGGASLLAINRTAWLLLPLVTLLFLVVVLVLVMTPVTQKT